MDGNRPPHLFRELGGQGELDYGQWIAAEHTDRLGAHHDRIQCDGAANALAGLGGQRHVPHGEHDFQYTQSYPGWSDANSKLSLEETAISSPSLAYNGDGTMRQVLIAWTGTDTDNHLNVAVISV